MATTWQDKLHNKLMDAVASVSLNVSERDALEAALSTADCWRDRLQELEQEDEDMEDEY